MASLDTRLQQRGWKPQGDFWVSPYDEDIETWVICRCGMLLATCYQSDLLGLAITCNHCGYIYEHNQPYTLAMFEDDTKG